MNRLSLFPGVELLLFSGTGEVALPLPETAAGLAIWGCTAGRLEAQGRTGPALEPGDRLLCRRQGPGQLAGRCTAGAGFLVWVEAEAQLPLPALAPTVADLLRRTESEDLLLTGDGSPEPLPEPEELALIQIKVLELFWQLGRQARPQNRQGQSQMTRIVHAVHRQLTQDMARRITIEALSRQYGVNPTTLKAAFKAVYGNSLAAHIKEHRMEAAARLLVATDLPLGEIAQQVGYESQSKFTAAFKSHFQMLPKDYRKQHRS